MTISRCIAFTSQPGSDELGRQPVEQLGVRRRLALEAEVLGGLHQPDAEMLLPEPVDGHAGGQRVLGRRQPAGQAQAVARARPPAAGSGMPGTPGSAFWLVSGMSYRPRFRT